MGNQSRQQRHDRLAKGRWVSQFHHTTSSVWLPSGLPWLSCGNRHRNADVCFDLCWRLVALRSLVGKVRTCYLVGSVVHSLSKDAARLISSTVQAGALHVLHHLVSFGVSLACLRCFDNTLLNNRFAVE